MDLNQFSSLIRSADPSVEQPLPDAIPNFSGLARRRIQRRRGLGGGIGALVLALVVAPNIDRGSSNLEFRSSVVASGSQAQGVSMGGSSLTLAAGETIAADQGLRSSTDGFSFANWGGKVESDALDATSMIALFGKDQVCIDPKAATCVMLPAAEAVAKQLNTAMSAGRCEGMSVLAQRFYDKVDRVPTGASSVFGIKKDVVAKQIGYYWATQVSPLVVAESKRTRALTPSQVALELALGLKGKKGYSLGMYTPKGGHSVTPIAVTKDGSNLNVLVYDNNHPNEIRKIVVDTKKETWTYAGAGYNSSSTKDTWTGGKGTIDITPMAARQAPFKVSLGGAGLKGNAEPYTVIVTQAGASESPVGLRVTGAKGSAWDTTDPASLVSAPFLVRSLVGGSLGQGAIAYVPSTLGELGKMSLKVVGDTSAGPITMTLSRGSSVGLSVESSSEFELQLERSLFSSTVEVVLPSSADTATVQVSNGPRAVEVGVVAGQTVTVTTKHATGDVTAGEPRRSEVALPEVVVAARSGEVSLRARLSEPLPAGVAVVATYSQTSSGEWEVQERQIEPSVIDESFVAEVTKPLEAAPSSDIANPLDLGGIELRAGALTDETTTESSNVTTTTVRPTTTTIAPTTTTIAPTTTTIAPTTTTTTPPPVVVAARSVRYVATGARTYGSTQVDWSEVTCTNVSGVGGCDSLAAAMTNGSVYMDAAATNHSASVGTHVIAVHGLGSLTNLTVTVDVTVSVVPKVIEVIAADAVKFEGRSDPDLAATVSGLVDGHCANVTLRREAGEAIGSYAIDLESLRIVGCDSGVDLTNNYTVAYTSGVLEVREFKNCGGGQESKGNPKDGATNGCDGSRNANVDDEPNGPNQPDESAEPAGSSDGDDTSGAEADVNPSEIVGKDPDEDDDDEDSSDGEPTEDELDDESSNSEKGPSDRSKRGRSS